MFIMTVSTKEHKLYNKKGGDKLLKDKEEIGLFINVIHNKGHTLSWLS